MSQAPDWWHEPRQISVVVDNPSWILPYAEQLVAGFNKTDDDAALCRSHEEIRRGGVAFYLGCVTITPPEVLARNHRNLVVHASDLPKGRGFSPMTWLVLEGRNEIPVCLLEAAEEVDSGPIIYSSIVLLQGHELIAEMRAALGALHVDLCRRFLAESAPPAGELQAGEVTTYRRRHPEDSRLDPGQSIAEQFNLFRVVDNDRYPAFFDLRGHRYALSIKKLGPAGNLP